MPCTTSTRVISISSTDPSSQEPPRAIPKAQIMCQVGLPGGPSLMQPRHRRVFRMARCPISVMVAAKPARNISTQASRPRLARTSISSDRGSSIQALSPQKTAIADKIAQTATYRRRVPGGTAISSARVRDSPTSGSSIRRTRGVKQSKGAEPIATIVRISSGVAHPYTPEHHIETSSNPTSCCMRGLASVDTNGYLEVAAVFRRGVSAARSGRLLPMS